MTPPALRLPALRRGSRRSPLLRLLAAGLAQGALAFVVVLLFARIGTAPLAQTVAALLALGLALGLLRAIETVEAERLGQAYVRALRRRLLERLDAAGGGGARGSLWLRLTGDLNGLRRWVGTGLARSLCALAMLATLGLALLVQAPWMALALPAALGPPLLAMLLLQARLRLREQTLRRARARLATEVDRWLDRHRPAAVSPVSEPRPQQQRLLRLRGRRVAAAAVARARVHALVRGLAECAPLSATAALLLAMPAHQTGVLLSILALAGLIAAPLRDLGLAWEMRQSYVVARHQVLAVGAAMPAATLHAWPPNTANTSNTSNPPIHRRER